jgi:subfamily B ATP-binding cassette protein MsbA
MDYGKIQNIFTTEIERYSNAFLQFFTIIENIILVISYIAVAFFTNFFFSLMFLIINIIIFSSFNILFKKTRLESEKYTQESNKFNDLILEFILNLKYLRITGADMVFELKILKKIGSLFNISISIGRIGSLLDSFREPILLFSICLTVFLYQALFNVPNAQIFFILIIFYRAFSFSSGIQSLVNKYYMYEGTINNVKSFNSTLFGNKNLSSENQSITLDKINRVELNNYTFMIGNKTILDDINFSFNTGDVVGIVGTSGSGKSFLINTLMLLYPTINKLEINGFNISKINVSELRRKIGYVAQESVIFNDSLFNNITLWDKKNEQNLIKFNDAIMNSGLSLFFQTIHNNEDSIINSGGSNLSGGERQGISIARELYKNVDVIYMDEPTSSLDNISEEAFIQLLETMKGNVTIIIVAHRLNTLRMADKIYKMESGKLKKIDLLLNEI